MTMIMTSKGVCLSKMMRENGQKLRQWTCDYLSRIADGWYLFPFILDWIGLDWDWVRSSWLCLSGEYGRPRSKFALALASHLDVQFGDGSMKQEERGIIDTFGGWGSKMMKGMEVGLRRVAQRVSCRISSSLYPHRLRNRAIS
ncbi:hypothetical protein FRC20_010791 [Serendipita sp. 405]|nr:hypothetical protein FRC20_010791 [Serendipita sp. 405]